MQGKIDDLKLDAQTKEVFKKTIDQELAKENSKYDEKYRKFKQKYVTCKTENRKLVIMQFTQFIEVINKLNMLLKKECWNRRK